jgi:hypothetical protein
MQMRKLMSAVAIGALAMGGGLAAAPADTPEEASNGCRGINEARGEDGGEGQAGETEAAEILDWVASLLDDDGCEDDGSASGDHGRP